MSGRWCLIKFSKTLVFSDSEPPIIKDGQEYKAKLDCDLFRLSHDNFSLLLKICHYKFNLTKDCSYYKSEC